MREHRLSLLVDERDRKPRSDGGPGRVKQPNSSGNLHLTAARPGAFTGTPGALRSLGKRSTLDVMRRRLETCGNCLADRAPAHHSQRAIVLARLLEQPQLSGVLPPGHEHHTILELGAQRGDQGQIHELQRVVSVASSRG